MTWTRLAATIAVACVVPLAVVACGESENEEFKEDYNAAVEPLRELSEDIGSSIGGAAGKSNDQIAKEFEKLADKAQETRDNLSELEPPDDANESFDKLLASLKQGIDDLRAVAQAAKDGDPAAARQASEDLIASGREIRQAERELREAVDG
jgi:dsDNA-specific endonuclease/ATPase MutS2